MELSELAPPREAEPPRPLTRSRALLTLPPAVTAPAADLSCEIVADPAAAEALRPAWAELLERSGRNELTLTPDWLLTWLRVYGPQQGRQLRLALVRDAGRLVGLAPLLARRHWHRAVLPFRRLEFLGSGEREGHGICSNHLNVLAERGAEAAVARRLATALTTGLFGAWDELVLPMMDADGPMPALLTTAFREAGLEAESFETARAPYIPLPATWEAYLKRLSCTRRHHLTRSLRAFDQWAAGTARLERITDLDGLEKGKCILIDLHHARWAGESRCGVFRAPSYLQFHDAALRWLLERRALELLYLTAHGKPVAALYGMSWGDKVYAYQIGRRLDVPANLRPGGVILAHAIRAAIEAGRREFDFLADEAPFKQRLALATRSLVRVRVVRPGMRESTRRLMERCLDGVRPLRRAVRDVFARFRGRPEEEANRPG